MGWVYWGSERLRAVLGQPRFARPVESMPRNAPTAAATGIYRRLALLIRDIWMAHRFGLLWLGLGAFAIRSVGVGRANTCQNNTTAFQKAPEIITDG